MFCGKKYVFLVISNNLDNTFEVLGVFTDFNLAESFYNHYYFTDRKLQIIKKVVNPTQHETIFL